MYIHTLSNGQNFILVSEAYSRSQGRAAPPILPYNIPSLGVGQEGGGDQGVGGGPGGGGGGPGGGVGGGAGGMYSEDK